MKKPLHDISSCTAYTASLPSGHRPIIAVHKESKIIAIGKVP
jgi:hypothetical protein